MIKNPSTLPTRPSIDVHEAGSFKANTVALTKMEVCCEGFENPGIHSTSIIVEQSGMRFLEIERWCSCVVPTAYLVWASCMSVTAGSSELDSEDCLGVRRDARFVLAGETG